MKPLHYTFNGEEHTVQHAEQFTIAQCIVRPEDMPHCIPESRIVQPRDSQGNFAKVIKLSQRKQKEGRRVLVEANSTPYEELADEWAVSLGQLRSWKSKGIIAGPKGRVWDYCERPVTTRSGRVMKLGFGKERY